MSIKLYYAPGACSLASHICIEEVGVPYEAIRLNLAEGTLPVSAGEHRLIVKAIASGDADAAGRAMFQHVMDSKQRTLAHDLRRRAPANA